MLARARGQTARAWHVMMVITARVVTRVAAGNARSRPSLVTQCVSTAMETAAGSRQDLDLRTLARRARVR